MSKRWEEFDSLASRRGLEPPRDAYLERSLRSVTFYLATLLAAAVSPEGITRLDARAKLFIATALILSMAFSRELNVVLAHTAVVCGLLGLSQVSPRRFFFSGFGVGALFALFMALPSTFHAFRPGTVVLEPGIPALAMTREGLTGASLLLARALTSLSAALWLALSTPWNELLAALRFVRLPALIVETIAITVSYVQVLLAQAQESILAKRSRTIARSALVSDQAWVGARIASSWQSSAQLMTEVHDAMIARGFTGQSLTKAGGRFAWGDRLACLAALAFCIGVHLV